MCLNFASLSFSFSLYLYLNLSLCISWPVSVRANSGEQERSRREASSSFLTYFFSGSLHCTPIYLPVLILSLPFISHHYWPQPKSLCYRKMRSQVGKVAVFVQSCVVQSQDGSTRTYMLTRTHTHVGFYSVLCGLPIKL